jgi:hypothetical protein
MVLALQEMVTLFLIFQVVVAFKAVLLTFLRHKGRVESMIQFPEDFKVESHEVATDKQINEAIVELIAKLEADKKWHVVRKVVGNVEVVITKEMYEGEKAQSLRISINKDRWETRFRIDDFNIIYSRNLAFEKCDTC